MNNIIIEFGFRMMCRILQIEESVVKLGRTHPTPPHSIIVK